MTWTKPRQKRENSITGSTYAQARIIRDEHRAKIWSSSFSSHAHAELQRLGDVFRPDAVAVGQIRNRACHFANPVVAAGTERHLPDRLIEQPHSRRIEATELEHERWRQLRVGGKPYSAVAVALSRARRDDPSPHRRRRFAQGTTGERLRR